MQNSSENPRGLSVEGGKGNPGEACKAGSLLVLVICLMIRGAGEPEQWTNALRISF